MASHDVFRSNRLMCSGVIRNSGSSDEPGSRPVEPWEPGLAGSGPLPGAHPVHEVCVAAGRHPGGQGMLPVGRGGVRQLGAPARINRQHPAAGRPHLRLVLAELAIVVGRIGMGLHLVGPPGVALGWAGEGIEPRSVLRCQRLVSLYLLLQHVH